ncbi:MAG: hypothetical protein AAB483_04275 [Patescibacteria group bacterium]
MNTETKNCQSCKKDFLIEPDDFSFYEQMHVPPPTWCPKCRMVRRLAWQGYRFLYKRTCDFSNEMVISTIPPDSPHKVYKQDIWWSDTWDPKSYGRDYDPNRPFFDQWKDLMLAVPMPALMTEYSTMIGSDYCNAAATLKNCYLCFKFDESEECGYCNTGTALKNSFDVSFSNFCELCYESTNLNKCYQVFFSQDCEDSHDIWFSRDLVGCNDCVGCVNLRKKSYYIFNQPYSKEEYQTLVTQYGFDTVKSIEEFKTKAQEFMLTQPRRQFHGYKNQDISGDYIYTSKNTKDSYMVRNSENLRYCQLLKAGDVHNAMDYTTFGLNAEWIYECGWVGIQVNNVKFSIWCYKSHDLEYCFGCHGAGNLFGCVGIRTGEYCILNKQYSKEEYGVLMEKIKASMKEYGEMLPISLCPWPYNESNAYEWFPITKDQALAQGFAWRDEDAREYKPASIQLPDHIKDVNDEILKEILKCDQCGRNYQIIGKELQFLKRFNLPIPRHCPLCRDRARIKQLNPIEIYQRQCAKCSKAIQTSYAPNRPEIVYCEECYQQEVS